MITDFNSGTQKQCGYSLLEVCVAMAILSVTISVSTPQFARLRARHDVHTTMEDIKNLVNQMTTLARVHQRDLVLKENLHRLVLSPRTSAEQRIRVVRLKESISVRINTQGQRIYAYTTNTLSPARITIRDERSMCSLTMSLRGRVRSDCEEVH